MDCIVHGGHKELDTTERLLLSLSFKGNKEGNLWVSGQEGTGESPVGPSGPRPPTGRFLTQTHSTQPFLLFF